MLPSPGLVRRTRTAAATAVGTEVNGEHGATPCCPHQAWCIADTQQMPRVPALRSLASALYEGIEPH